MQWRDLRATLAAAPAGEPGAPEGSAPLTMSVEKEAEMRKYCYTRQWPKVWAELDATREALAKERALYADLWAAHDKLYCEVNTLRAAMRTSGEPAARALADAMVSCDGGDEGCVLCGGEHFEHDERFIAHERTCPVPTHRLTRIGELMDSGADPALLSALTDAQVAWEKATFGRAALPPEGQP